MIKTTIKALSLSAFLAIALSASSFNAQAEKDRMGLRDYMMKKFSNPLANRAKFFPYATTDELKNILTPVKNINDFRLGAYAYNKTGKEQHDDMVEMPPFLDDIDAGEEIYNSNAALKKCFPDPAIVGEYPMFDEKKGEVVTLTGAINSCLKAAGQKPFKWTKGKITQVEAYFADKSKEAGKKIDIKINSKAAMEAYERGKKEYYSQRGYLKLSCASCHVQGSGQRVRLEYLSPLLGAVTHFPVYRMKWTGLGTLERRIKGCEKNQGENPHKPTSKWTAEMLYFMAYMSNGLPLDGPDVRR
jgi:sulfur-oxidizing protein SoxA